MNKTNTGASREERPDRIIYETPLGYITIVQTGRSLSYAVWLHGVTAAKRIATVGLSYTNALEKAKSYLK